ncbi:unnamed protein product, partial [Ascophyllum nodosum]
MHGSPMLLSAQQSRLSSLYGPTTMSTARRAADGNTSLAKRKSCDFCYTHKKKCGGDGVNPCRRCARKGEHHPCIYSARKRKERRRQSRDSFPEATQTSAETELVGAQSLTRYTLSASPATGLIGMPENVLLQYFFEC